MLAILCCLWQVAYRRRKVQSHIPNPAVSANKPLGGVIGTVKKNYEGFALWWVFTNPRGGLFCSSYISFLFFQFFIFFSSLGFKYERRGCGWKWISLLVVESWAVVLDFKTQFTTSENFSNINRTTPNKFELWFIEESSDCSLLFIYIYKNLTGKFL